MTIHIDIACNDPDNGLFAGRISGITIGKSDIELEPVRFTGPAMRHTTAGIVVSGKSFACTFTIEWIGNWCWNRYDFTESEAVRFLLWIRHRHSFNLQSAESRFYKLWKTSGTISSDLLLKVLKGAIHD
ncbi:hypothetical protein [Sphingorhabdus sp. 109]|uniref:hypothetical protein n=1 Tax=Sphingorhabdus sp. 109 TaxID=2653173 RepID=UPI0013574CC6|nr:hypothetical protein [Sphingorhabdus sp. 109]